MEIDLERGVVEGFDVVGDALASLRARTLERWRALPDDAWAQPSRCGAWTVHEVVRHVRDGCKIHVARLCHEPPVFPSEAGFDQQDSPNVWLESSAGESPADTLDELATLTTKEAVALSQRDTSSDETEVGPYGPVHWTGFSAHMLWDAWIHDRDVSVPLSADHDASGDEDFAAATYGIFIATVPARLTGHPIVATVELGRPPSAPLLVAAEPGFAATREGDGATVLRGSLLEVIDALAGRGAPIDDVLTGDPTMLEPFTWLRAFMTPT